MKIRSLVMTTICLSFLGFLSCNEEQKKGIIKAADNTVEQNIKEDHTFKQKVEIDDGRISLNLNPMQKNHQLSNMRSHLEAIQQITLLLSQENYDEASMIAYTKLGSTTEMRLMCASFGDKAFENLGLEFHKSADAMSDVFKKRNKDNSLTALSNTLNYCVQCHATYKQ
ncbi:hypothetical protein [Psychroserpens ponticola]|uniref:Cytochrome C n=1 Tax=Psychroserpens ponticola TaxID=2932268 RepID=A0ABY7S0R2_9FLAO|nr:hypothetical protein [Psychroserpens ponticola]WCO02883.1 hypothetical protein MUN68_005170 [Psychroserpens ponticola]